MKFMSWGWLPLVVVLPIVACEAPAERPEEAPPAAEAPPAETTTARQMVHVMNRMPHVMVVSVVEEDGVRELGDVPPNEMEMFTVEGERGEEVELVARDEAETHSVDFTFEVGEEEVPTWTLGGG